MNDKIITVYNAHKNADKTETWKRTVIRGCEYKYSADKTVSGSGSIVFTQLFTAVVPMEADTEGKQYIDAVSYEKLPDDEVEKYFTFNLRNNHDMIVAGECEKEITKDYKITDLKNDTQESGIIASLADNTEGTLLKHWKVVCK
nr:MAG TPA: hypothetical protein [Caudoviricetes sp.]